MSFESIRKFVSVRKGKKRSDALLSLNIIENGKLKNGDTSYSVSILVHHELIEHVGWNEKTRIDVLVDSENRLCMLKPDNAGFALSFPTKNHDGGYEGVSATIKFRLPEPFAYIPKDLDRLELTIIDCSDSVVFEMPKIKDESSEPQLPKVNTLLPVSIGSNVLFR